MSDLLMHPNMCVYLFKYIHKSNVETKCDFDDGKKKLLN